MMKITWTPEKKREVVKRVIDKIAKRNGSNNNKASVLGSFVSWLNKESQDPNLFLCNDKADEYFEDILDTAYNVKPFSGSIKQAQDAIITKKQLISKTAQMNKSGSSTTLKDQRLMHLNPLVTKNF